MPGANRNGTVGPSSILPRLKRRYDAPEEDDAALVQRIREGRLPVPTETDGHVGPYVVHETRVLGRAGRLRSVQIVEVEPVRSPLLDDRVVAERDLDVEKAFSIAPRADQPRPHRFSITDRMRFTANQPIHGNGVITLDRAAPPFGPPLLDGVLEREKTAIGDVSVLQRLRDTSRLQSRGLAEGTLGTEVRVDEASHAAAPLIDVGRDVRR